MLPGMSSALGGKDQSALLLRQIRNSIFVICAVHVVLFFATVIVGGWLLSTALDYSEYLQTELSGPKLQATAASARGIVNDVKTVTGVVAAVVGGVGPGANATLVAAGARRSLLMDAAVATALTGLIDTANGKLAGLDTAAPLDFLRYIMAIRWRTDVAPYTTQVLATAERAETFVGSLLRALGTTVDATLGPGWWLSAPPGNAAAAVGRMVGL